MKQELPVSGDESNHFEGILEIENINDDFTFKQKEYNDPEDVNLIDTKEYEDFLIFQKFKEQHSKEIADKIEANKIEEEQKSQSKQANKK